MSDFASIYNSRNYYRLLNKGVFTISKRSTTVEITIGYLTGKVTTLSATSTTVEITIGYLTTGMSCNAFNLQQ